VIHTKGWPRSLIGLEWHSEIPGCLTKNAFENKVIHTLHFSEKQANTPPLPGEPSGVTTWRFITTATGPTRPRCRICTGEDGRFLNNFEMTSPRQHGCCKRQLTVWSAPTMVVPVGL
jgi:hypothetical protein